ncbi:MAG: Hsp20/alpha crystallin family protein [Halobacteriaceae archaeon]
MSRGNPFREIERVLDRINERFDEDFGTDLGFRGMPVDVQDRGDAFVVTADLPAFDSEDIEVELLEDTLSISAERTTTSDEEDLTGRYIRRERLTESASRNIELPEEVEVDAVEATFDDGVLRVTLPKAADAGDAYQIDVE